MVFCNNCQRAEANCEQKSHIRRFAAFEGVSFSSPCFRSSGIVRTKSWNCQINLTTHSSNISFKITNASLPPFWKGENQTQRAHDIFMFECAVDPLMKFHEEMTVVKCSYRIRRAIWTGWAPKVTTNKPTNEGNIIHFRVFFMTFLLQRYGIPLAGKKRLLFRHRASNRPFDFVWMVRHD